jgi:hypothetical protein
VGKMVQIAAALSKQEQVKVADSEKAVNSLGSAPRILRPIDAEPGKMNTLGVRRNGGYACRHVEERGPWRNAFSAGLR